MVVTIREKNLSQLPKDLFEGVDDRVVVIDTGNYYPRQRDDVSTPSRRERRRACGSRSSLAARWSRPSTTSMPSICATTADQLAHPAGTSVCATDLDAEGVQRALAEATPERLPDFRATPTARGLSRLPPG